jgi:hypothetical protein
MLKAAALPAITTTIAMSRRPRQPLQGQFSTLAAAGNEAASAQTDIIAAKAAQA